MTQQTLFEVEISPAEVAARRLIRSCVKQGYDPKRIMSGFLGHSSPSGMWASISGHIEGEYFGSDKIVVFRDINGKEVNQVFAFKDVYEAVQAE